MSENPTIDALTDVVAAEDAAIFTYGLITAFAAPARRSTIDEYSAEHRAAREEAAQALRDAGVTPPDLAAGYTLPIEVTDSVTAAQAALIAEDDTAVAYRSLLERGTDESARRIGLTGLTASALRAAGWRAALRQSPFTVAFPGRPA